MDWDTFLEMGAKINKTELRLNFERAKEYMTAYEIADTMRQAFDKEELAAIVDILTTRGRF